jgi:EAL domain-containing protein (putative c-di-GMP-specific phosphodiesterase class I)
MASMVTVPLQRNGSTIGVVNMVARRPHAFTDADVQRCTTLADVLAAMICSTAEISSILSTLTATDAGSPVDLGGEKSSAVVARFVSNVLSPATADLVDVRRRIRTAIDERRFTIVYQPIVRADDRRLVAVEALSRFTGPPEEPPDHWFAAAATCGLGVELDLAAFGAALDALPRLPDDVQLGVNIGPEALAAPELGALLEQVDASRVIIELTEHAPVHDYGSVQAVLASLRRLGTRLSVDDTGAGFASLTHIVKLAPEFIKLDRWIVANVDADAVRRALVVALVGFAHQLGARVVGEGIETAAELETLHDLGVDFAQGFHLARPGPLDAAVALDRRATPAA